MRRVLYLSAVLLLLWVGLALAATEVICIVDTDPDAEDAHYHSLAAAIAGESGENPQCVTSADLVTNDEQLTIECRATSGAADDAVVISGFVTGPDNRIIIYVPPAHRHSGVWDTGKSRIESSGRALTASDTAFIDIIGLQITSSNNIGITHLGPQTGVCTISHCIIKGQSSNYRPGLMIGIYSMVYRIFNNIIYDWNGTGGTGISRIDGDAYIYNNTVVNCEIGIDGATANRTCIAVNNIVQDCATCFSDSTYFDTGTTNNLSNDLTAPGDNALTEKTLAFADAANDNYALASIDTDAIDAGVNLSSDAGLSFNTDIIGTSRPQGAAWDIGAFEYVVSGGNGSKWNGITPATWNGVNWSNLKWNGM